MKGLFQGLGVKPHFVYRVFDADDQLLYIGCSVDVGRRMQQHRHKGAPWIDRAARWTVEEHRDFWRARDAEWRAIGAERPLYNVRGQIA